MIWPQARRVVGELSGKKKAKPGQIEGATAEERVNKWYSHFKELLGEPPVVEDEEEDIPEIYTDLGIDDGPFSMEELTKVKKSLRLGKSSGPDGLPAEIYKCCELDEILLDICNEALVNNKRPEEWSVSDIIPVPKKGNLTKPGNYRGISLTCIASKIYNKLILNRIRTAIDPKLRNNQNGFRAKRSTVSQILALRRIIEEVKKHNLTAVMTFIDFKKAFDSIHRGKMLKILQAYGVPPQLLQAIELMYADTRAKVRTPDGDTEEFSIKAGVLQRDTLAPFLFIIMLDYALRKATDDHEHLGFTITPRKSRRTKAVTLTDLDFADDIGLISDQISQAQELLLRVENECQKVGLHLNSKKTEYMTFNIRDHQPLTTKDGSKLERQPDFKYLGAWVNDSEADIKVRKALAWKALHDMRKIWRSTLSKELRIRYFRATVETILLYGCESWTLTTATAKALDGCYTRMLRMALNVSWKDKIPNQELYAGLPKVTDTVRSRRLKLAGHCYRHQELLAGQVVLWEPTHGRVGRGRPRITFVDTLRKDIGVTTVGELASCMQDRDGWRRRFRFRLDSRRK